MLKFTLYLFILLGSVAASAAEFERIYKLISSELASYSNQMRVNNLMLGLAIVDIDVDTNYGTVWPTIHVYKVFKSIPFETLRDFIYNIENYPQYVPGIKSTVFISRDPLVVDYSFGLFLDKLVYRLKHNVVHSDSTSFQFAWQLIPSGVDQTVATIEDSRGQWTLVKLDDTQTFLHYESFNNFGAKSE